MIEKIKNILQWWDDMLCPLCGNEMTLNAKYGCGEWYAEEYGKKAHEKCDKCGFVHCLEYDNRMPDELYLESIRKVVEND